MVHIINLTAQEVLKSLKAADDKINIIKKVSEITSTKLLFIIILIKIIYAA